MLINAHKRDPKQTKVNEIRRQGLVPAVIYGKKLGSVSISVDGKDAINLLRSGDLMVDLKVNGGAQHTANLRNCEKDTLNGTVKHLSFFEVEKNKPIDMEIPIKIEGIGNSPGAKQGGVINHHLSELHVSCLPKDAVNEIIIDVSALELEGQIHLNEIKLPQGISLYGEQDKDRLIIDCHKPKEQVMEPDNKPEAEAAEGGEAAAAGEEKAAAPAEGKADKKES